MDMLYIYEHENPLSLRIFGGEKNMLVEAAQYVDKYTAEEIIDINMGCPVNNIIKCEAGAKWSLHPIEFNIMETVYELTSISVSVV